jgi:MFS family permease
LRSIAIGVRFVFANQILVGSMALDLFAVLFGGAVALLPVFATEILKIGATGVGLLNAAPAAGGILIMLWSTRHPPIRHAGRNLLLCVAGFGVSIIVFALSENFYLSMFALAASGACDGVSVVIRRAILRLNSPEHMRGRVAAVNMIFISASNELGAFESGIAAAALGTVRSVWLGGVVTLLIAGGAAIFAPKLRRLNLGAGAWPTDRA